MAVGKHLVTWPKVRITVDGKSKILVKGESVPDGVDPTVLSNLVSFGAIAGVYQAAPVEDDGSSEGAPSKPAKVEDILALVGTDKGLAQEALDAEIAAKGDKARKSLVEALQAVLGAPPAGS